MSQLAGCTQLLFYPQKQWVRTPAALGIEYEDVELTAADGTRLSAWWLEAYGDVKGTVVFFHGNAENISTHLGSVYWLPEQGYQVMMLDYRGYGRSEGKPGLPEIFSDIEAALEWTFEEPRTANKPVYVLGQSLGAAMSSFVVANRQDLNVRLSAVV
ncbi:MAG: alpha/beta hydrolase, partial [Gammaproteobacteria bacterium]